MSQDPRLEATYRDAMAEINAVLKKYDLAGAITLVSKERAMFRYHFPTWGVLKLEGNDKLRFRSKRKDFPSEEAQHEATELSLHVVLQMRDIAAQTFDLMEQLHARLSEHMEIEHKPFQDFNPERDH